MVVEKENRRGIVREKADGMEDIDIKIREDIIARRINLIKTNRNAHNGPCSLAIHEV